MAYEGNLRPHDEVQTLTLKNTAFDVTQRIRTLVLGWRIPFSERRNLLFLVDILIVLLAVGVTHWLGQFSVPEPLGGEALYQRWYWFLMMAGSWWVLAYLNDLYSPPSADDRLATTLRIASAGALGLIGFFVLDYFFPTLLPLRFSLYALMLALLVVLGWRFVYIKLLRTISAPQRVLILGSSNQSQLIGQWLQQVSAHDYQVLGYVDDKVDAQPFTESAQPSADHPAHETQAMLTHLGATTDLLHLIRQWSVDEVLVAIKDDLSQDLFQRLAACQGRGVRVAWMADIYERLAYCIPVQYVNPTWALCAMQGKPIFGRLPLIGKRLLDLVIVLFSLPIFCILLPLIGLVIRLTSAGPIFYHQVRSGRGGKPFTIYKFRTMFVDAEKDGKARWATKNDPRITPVGRFLRKMRLDELPQIINILQGDMSIVGPRPERPEFVEELQKAIPFYQVRLTVKPGLTGWAQVHYDYGNSVDDALWKLQYDFYYVHNWSLWLDLYIMFKTFNVVFKFKGL